MITRIDHVAILLPELSEGTHFWAGVLGLELERIEEVPEQQVRIAMLPVGDSHVELISPSEETSGVARYLEKRGPGLHHICLEVENIDAMLIRLKKANIPLIDEEPRIGDDGKKLAFIHPKGTGGVLVELYQYPRSD